MASTCLIFGWAMIINNIGRRKYPQYWWAPGRQFVVDPATVSKGDEEMANTNTGEVDRRRREASQQGRPQGGEEQDKATGRGRN
jgi:hypothetical protein